MKRDIDMKMPRLRYLLLCSALLLSAQPSLAMASADRLFKPFWQLAQNTPLTAKQAAKLAEKKFGGRVLNIKPQGDNYRIKLLQESGRVIHVIVDANKGTATKS
jgi:uncharacterized membrane protein YkoI